MYGNNTLPGITASDTYEVTAGSIWRGYTEATWFETVQVSGTDGADIPAGTIMKENNANGTYSPITAADIITEVANLPGARLAIVADHTAKSGVTITEGNEETMTPSTVLVGISGVVDKSKLLVDNAPFDELTKEQKICLNVQLEAWHFQLVNVMQA